MPRNAAQLTFTPGRIIGTVVVLAVALTCMRLGFWQIDRLGQKRAINQALQSRSSLPPVELGTLPQDSAGLIFRRALVSGTYDDARTIVLAGRSDGGAPGVHVLTPLRVGNAAVLVNRGWMPSSDGRTIDLATIREAAPAGALALIEHFHADDRAAPDTSGTFKRVWYALSLPALRPQFPYRLAPFIVQLLPEKGIPAEPKRIAMPEMDEGPHLGYAIQWFSFAVIAVAGWIAVLLRGMRK